MSETVRNLPDLIRQLWNPASLRGFVLLPLVVAFVAFNSVCFFRQFRRRMPDVEQIVAAALAYNSALLSFCLLSLVLGELHLAYLTAFVSSMVAIMVVEASFAKRPFTLPSVKSSVALLRPSGGLPWVIAIVAVFTVLFVVAARPPVTVDEVQYHWAAPVYWAAHHGVVRSPYKFTNGPALMEISYLLPAVARASTLAHWMTLAFAGSLCLSVAALGHRLGFRPVIGAAAVLSIPNLLIISPTSQTDVPLAALLAAALCALVLVRDHRCGDVVAGVFLAGAYSVKSLLAVAEAVPLVLIVVLARPVLTRGEGDHEQWEEVIPGVIATARTCVRIGSIPAAAAALWSIHTWLLIRQPFESSRGFTIVHTSSALLATGQATGRWPSWADVLTLPLLPLRAAVLGNREPFGGRTGYLPLLYIVITCGWAWHRYRHSTTRDGTDYRRTVSILLGMLMWLCSVAAIFAKTRFLYLPYALIGAMVPAFVWPPARPRPHDRFTRALAGLAVALMVAGVADGLRVSLGLTV